MRTSVIYSGYIPLKARDGLVSRIAQTVQGGVTCEVSDSMLNTLAGAVATRAWAGLLAPGLPGPIKHLVLGSS